MSSEDLQNEVELLQQTDNLPNENFLDKNREKAITDVIEQLKTSIEKESTLNLKLKVIFFVICCSILILLAITLVCMADTMMRYNLPDNSSQFAIELVSVVASFIAAFMILPKIIAKDLFSAKIQNSIVKIITEHLHK